MSLPEVNVMFTQMPQPLAYAQALLAQFASLARAVNGAQLLGDFVRSLAELSGCELSQLYLLDATHKCLKMRAECLDGTLQPREAASLPVDYNGEQLLQFALCQNRVVCLGELSGSLHETSFLPAQSTPWQSLLCVPVVNHQQAVEGLLLCASRRHVDLQGFADSLGQFGSFALGQLNLLQRLHKPADEVRPAVITMPSVSGYGLIGKSASMRQTYTMISKVLHSPYTVLLRGETGTGKEVVARAIHDFGPRRSQPFIVQNCAAFPEHLLESELFGYRKGAFTGADSDRTGLFEAANGGTLLLDEIGDIPLPLQAKLL
ncbi:sigma-54 dependent transcriptional regulator, partial [Pseudomonas syringae pv. actinidiae ICMP 19096]